MTPERRREMSATLISLAEARRCPSCSRKGAMVTRRTDGVDVSIRVCRWCRYEMATRTVEP